MTTPSPPEKMVRKVVLFPPAQWRRLEQYLQASGARLPELVRSLVDDRLTAKGC